MKFGGDTDRINIIEQIKILLEIPEIEDYFSRELSKARHEFQDKIDEYHNLKKNIESELLKDKRSEVTEEEVLDLPQPLSKSKTYFFELTRVQKSKIGFQWELGKFKLQADKRIINMIFSDFIKKVDEYQTVPNHIQNETVYSPALDMCFLIRFTKSSDTRVVGFVKAIEKDEDEFALEDIRNMPWIIIKLKKLPGEELNATLNKLIKTKPDLVREMFLYLLKKLNSNR